MVASGSRLGDPRYVRASVRDQFATDRLLAALRDVLSEQARPELAGSSEGRLEPARSAHRGRCRSAARADARGRRLRRRRGSSDFKLKIGVLVPLTGPRDALGKAGQEATKLAQAQIDTAIRKVGAEHTVQLLREDEGPDPGTTSTAATKLKDEKATCVVGPYSSSNALVATNQVLVPADIPIISPAASRRPDLEHQGRRPDQPHGASRRQPGTLPGGVDGPGAEGRREGEDRRRRRLRQHLRHEPPEVVRRLVEEARRPDRGHRDVEGQERLHGGGEEAHREASGCVRLLRQHEHFRPPRWASSTA